MDQRWCLGNTKTNKVEKNLYPNQVAQRVIENIKEGYNEADWVVWLSGWPAWKPLPEIQELVHEINLLKKISEDTPPPMMVQPSMPPPPPPMEQLKPQFVTPKTPPAPAAPAVTATVTPIPKPPSAPVPPVAPMVQRQPELVIPKPPMAPPKPVTPQSHRKDEDHNQEFPHKRKHKRIFVRFRCIIRSSTITFRTFTKDISLGGVALEDEIPVDLVGTECMIYITSPKANKNLKFHIALTNRTTAKYFSFQEADATLLDELSQWLDEHRQESVA